SAPTALHISGGSGRALRPRVPTRLAETPPATLAFIPASRARPSHLLLQRDTLRRARRLAAEEPRTLATARSVRRVPVRIAQVLCRGRERSRAADRASVMNLRS